jgi:predicted AAA+ superfamily ATPase
MKLKRNIDTHLVKWKNSPTRKPLVVRGARQVGKTHSIKAFAEKEFHSLIYLNLEKSEDKNLFENLLSAEQFVNLLNIRQGNKIFPGNTLIFIDEIQESENALTQLRYLYEEMPELHVIAAGSLLEVMLFKKKISVPVGRVEYLYMHPLTFEEFLGATGQDSTVEYIQVFEMSQKIPESIHVQLMKKYMEYALVGGMPEVVSRYASGNSLIDLNSIYESLLVGFRDDIAKYTTPSQARYLVHCFDNTPIYVGTQIAYNNFAESNFRSREISLSFDTLELSYLVSRVFSSRSVNTPIVQNRKKAPKLVFLDVGLVNYKIGQREKFLSFSELEGVYQGQISEQIVGQSLIAHGANIHNSLYYWYRDKKGSNAEVDYLVNLGGDILAIEVKAGLSNSLKSLRSFIDEAGAKKALRVYSGPPLSEEAESLDGRKYTLVSLPYYLFDRYVELIS